MPKPADHPVSKFNPADQSFMVTSLSQKVADFFWTQTPRYLNIPAYFCTLFMLYRFIRWMYESIQKPKAETGAGGKDKVKVDPANNFVHWKPEESPHLKKLIEWAKAQPGRSDG
jgi:hypothetical protein